MKYNSTVAIIFASGPRAVKERPTYAAFQKFLMTECMVNFNLLDLQVNGFRG